MLTVGGILMVMLFCLTAARDFRDDIRGSRDRDNWDDRNRDNRVNPGPFNQGPFNQGPFGFGQGFSNQGSFGQSGYIDRTCLDCICKKESGCRNIGCRNERDTTGQNREVCGYYKISQSYYIDCGQPNKQGNDMTARAWRRCASDQACAERCVKEYMRRYAYRCDRRPTCETYARLHQGGPSDCRSSVTNNYWQDVRRCLY